MGLDKYKKTPCGFCFVEYPFQNHFHSVVIFYLFNDILYINMLC
jgi:hypothetical protein